MTKVRLSACHSLVIKKNGKCLKKKKSSDRKSWTRFLFAIVSGVGLASAARHAVDRTSHE